MNSESFIENLFKKKKSPEKKKKKLSNKLKKLKIHNLKQIAGKLDINNNKAKQFGKCSCKKTYIKAINNKLKQSGGSYDGYCHDLISQCSDSYAAC
jgi:hypothetical protein